MGPLAVAVGPLQCLFAQRIGKSARSHWVAANLLSQWKRQHCDLRRIAQIAILFASLSALNAAAQPDEAEEQNAAVQELPGESEYIELKITRENEKDLKKQGKGTIPKILKDRNFGANEEQHTATLKKYFWSWFFPEMTAPEKIAPQREKLKKFFENTNKIQATEALNRLTFEMMAGFCRGPLLVSTPSGKTEVVQVGERFFTLNGAEIEPNTIQGKPSPATRDFHPAVKYNAMLIIGELNNPKNKRNETTKPWREKYSDLEAYTQPSSDPRRPDMLRVAALVGIKRYCYVEGMDSEKQLIARAMLKILAEEVRTNTDIWIQRQAIDILGELGKNGTTDDAVLSALGGLIADQQEPMPLRIAAAHAVGKIHLNDPPAAGVVAYAKQLGNLAVELTDVEIEGEQTRSGTFSATRLSTKLGTILFALEGPVVLEDASEGNSSPPGGLIAMAREGDEKTYLLVLANQVRLLKGFGEKIAPSIHRNRVAAQLKPFLIELRKMLAAENPPAPPVETADRNAQ
jgi:hypothetical protein